jgi:hypothetical protein
MDWENLFAASGAKLKASLGEARAALKHSTLKGNLNEEAVAMWLQQWLPGSIDVCTGEVIDSDGGRSKQVDVLMFDHATTPRFFSRGNINVVPIESVYAVLEVKTHLNKAEVENAFDNMKAIKTLQKKAFHEGFEKKTRKLYGLQTHYWPVQFLIFAYESDSLETVLGHVERLNAGQPIHQRIDMVCVLDKGLIMNVGPDGIESIPMPYTNLVAKESSKTLLTFFTLMSHLYGQASSEPIAMHHYLKHIVH